MTKRAIVLANYGTMNIQEGEAIYRGLAEGIQNNFPDMDIFSTYNSKRIVKKLNEKYGIKILNLEEQLNILLENKYEEVYVQPTYLIRGSEYTALETVIEKYVEKFKRLEIGAPLLNSKEDYEDIVDIFTKKYTDRDTAYIFICHGGKTDAVSAYGMLGYKLNVKNRNFFTITLDDVLPMEDIENRILDEYSKVQLVPLLIVSGHHFNRDILENILPKLCDKGVQTSVEKVPLGQELFITTMFSDHIRNKINS